MSHRQINFIKIDVEGMEMAVLDSGRAVMEKCRPVILFEYSPYYYTMMGFDWYRVVSFFRGLEYSLTNVNGTVLNEDSRLEGELFWNIIALPN